jgi:hypothetical protein
MSRYQENLGPASQVALQRHNDALREELLARDRKDLERQNQEAADREAAAANEVERQKAAAQAAEAEKARQAAWRWANFDRAYRERPHEPLIWDDVYRVPEKGWPADGSEEQWRATQSSLPPAPVSLAAVADTSLAKQLRELEAHDERIRAAG